MAEVRCTLPRFLAHHERLGVDESEGVDHDFAFHGLDWINDDGNSSRS